jgi:hypothetical protein
VVIPSLSPGVFKGSTSPAKENMAIVGSSAERTPETVFTLERTNLKNGFQTVDQHLVLLGGLILVQGRPKKQKYHQFFYESGLIVRDKSIIDLRGADLRGAPLISAKVILEQLELSVNYL